MSLVRCKRWILSKGLIIVAIVGFVVQAVQVSYEYFQFTTTTHVSFNKPERIEKHSLAVCIRFSDILDKERLFRETGIRLKHPLDLASAIQQEDSLTVDQVFEYTPNANETIVKCTHRPEDWTIVTHHGSKCRTIFTVRKFFMLEFMCYIVAEKSEIRLWFDSVSRSTFAKGSVYTVYLNTSLNGMNRMSPIAFRGQLPLISRDHSQVFSAMNSSSGKPQYAYMTVTPSDLDLYLLPSPYNTHCRHATETEIDDCRRECLVRAYAHFSRVPGYEVLTERYKLKPLATKDVMDRVTGPVIRQKHHSCESRCSKRECHNSYTVTKARYRMTDAPTIGFSLAAPIEPKVIITTHPTMRFIEYFCLMCSCFGTWFGLSFLSLRSLKRNHEPEGRNNGNTVVIVKAAWHRRNI